MGKQLTGNRMKGKVCSPSARFQSTGTDQGDLETIRKAKNIDDGGVTAMKKGGRTKKKNKICPEGIAWAKRTFDKYPSAYANLAASKYCKDPNYAKKAKGGKRKGK